VKELFFSGDILWRSSSFLELFYEGEALFWSFSMKDQAKLVVKNLFFPELDRSKV